MRSSSIALLFAACAALPLTNPATLAAQQATTDSVTTGTVDVRGAGDCTVQVGTLNASGHAASYPTGRPARVAICTLGVGVDTVALMLAVFPADSAHLAGTYQMVSPDEFALAGFAGTAAPMVSGTAIAHIGQELYFDGQQMMALCWGSESGSIIVTGDAAHWRATGTIRFARPSERLSAALAMTTMRPSARTATEADMERLVMRSTCLQH